VSSWRGWRDAPGVRVQAARLPRKIIPAQTHSYSVREARRKFLPPGRKFYGNFTSLLPFLYDTVQYPPLHSME
jgi:hypothetical protein